VASREELLGIGVGRGGAGHMQRVTELDRARAQWTGHRCGAAPEGTAVAHGIHGQRAQQPVEERGDRWRNAAAGRGARRLV
jgi:hypothetical protein